MCRIIVFEPCGSAKPADVRLKIRSTCLRRELRVSARLALPKKFRQLRHVGRDASSLILDEHLGCRLPSRLHEIDLFTPLDAKQALSLRA